jgi:hypothetical protein
MTNSLATTNPEGAYAMIAMTTEISSTTPLEQQTLDDAVHEAPGSSLELPGATARGS